MKPIVFIHTSDKQMLAARLSAYSLRTRSKDPDHFEVRLLRLEETAPSLSRPGRPKRYLWAARVCIWRNRDLQAFGPLRFLVPQLMSFQGRALVIDPDIFAIADVHELLQRDMNEKAIICRRRSSGRYTSSVMLLDCARLKHWDWNWNVDATFAFKLDTCMTGFCLVGEKSRYHRSARRRGGITSIHLTEPPNSCTTLSVSLSRGRPDSRSILISV